MNKLEKKLRTLHDVSEESRQLLIREIAKPIRRQPKDEWRNMPYMKYDLTQAIANALEGTADFPGAQKFENKLYTNIHKKDLKKVWYSIINAQLPDEIQERIPPFMAVYFHRGLWPEKLENEKKREEIRRKILDSDEASAIIEKTILLPLSNICPYNLVLERANAGINYLKAAHRGRNSTERTFPFGNKIQNIKYAIDEYHLPKPEEPEPKQEILIQEKLFNTTPIHPDHDIHKTHYSDGRKKPKRTKR